MDVQDLNYIFEHFKSEKMNTYKSVSIGSNSSHINFLKNSEFNYDIKEIGPAKKEFKIFTKENKLIDKFVYPYYPYTSEYALKLTRNKFKAEEHFHKYKFPTTESKLYSYDEIEMAKSEYFKNDSHAKVVIKPFSSSLGRGVFVNVSKERFEENWELSKNDLTISELKEENNLRFLVQNYLEGFEVRATILQGTLVSLIARIPPYVVGDGQNQITKLIDIKNKDRDSCAYLSKYPIKITTKMREFLKSHDLSLDYVPMKNERVLLSSVSNIAQGGETINITDKVSKNIKEFALDVLASIPGIYSGGLDLILKSFNDQNPHIIEVNTYPVISLTKYPKYGEPSNPSKILFESLIAQYQLGKDDKGSYVIEDADSYTMNFLQFTKRRLKFFDKIYDTYL